MATLCQRSGSGRSRKCGSTISTITVTEFAHLISPLTASRLPISKTFKTCSWASTQTSLSFARFVQISAMRARGSDPWPFEVAKFLSRIRWRPTSVGGSNYSFKGNGSALRIRPLNSGVRPKQMTQQDQPPEETDRWSSVAFRASERNRADEQSAAFRVVRLIHGISALGALIVLVDLGIRHQFSDRPVWYIFLLALACVAATLSAISGWLLARTPTWLPLLASLSVILSIAPNTRTSLVLWANVISLFFVYQIHRRRSSPRAA